MELSMRSPASRYTCRFLVLVASIMPAIPAAQAAPQENPSAGSATYGVCSDLGEYIFVGGTAGFDALRDGDQFEALVRTGHVGLYEHENAISAAAQRPQ